MPLGHWGSLGEETGAVCLKQANKTLTDRPFICIVLHLKILAKGIHLHLVSNKSADTRCCGLALPWGWRMPLTGKTL